MDLGDLPAVPLLAGPEFGAPLRLYNSTDGGVVLLRLLGRDGGGGGGALHGFWLRTLVVRRAFRLFSNVARRAAVVLIAGLWASAAQRLRRVLWVFGARSGNCLACSCHCSKFGRSEAQAFTLFSRASRAARDGSTALGGTPVAFGAPRDCLRAKGHTGLHHPRY